MNVNLAAIQVAKRNRLAAQDQDEDVWNRDFFDSVKVMTFTCNTEFMFKFGKNQKQKRAIKLYPQTTMINQIFFQQSEEEKQP